MGSVMCILPQLYILHEEKNKYVRKEQWWESHNSQRWDNPPGGDPAMR